ncbi:5557_t:CDS:2, partial [Cetraspora pellucida]
ASQVEENEFLETNKENISFLDQNEACNSAKKLTNLLQVNNKQQWNHMPSDDNLRHMSDSNTSEHIQVDENIVQPQQKRPIEELNFLQSQTFNEHVTLDNLSQNFNKTATFPTDMHVESSTKDQSFNSTESEANADLTSNPIAMNTFLKSDEAEFILVTSKNKRNKSKKKDQDRMAGPSKSKEFL